MSKKFNYQGLVFEVFDEHLRFSINTPLEERFIKKVYEKREIVLIKKHIKEDDIVLDLGSSLGITSCVIAKRLITATNLVAVEANSNLIKNIQRNQELNNLPFYIKSGVISHDNRMVKFNFNGLSQSGSILSKKHLIGKKQESAYGKYQQTEVKTITPMDIEKEFEKKFNVLVCDIEGEEFDMLFNLFHYFQYYDKILVEFHPHRNDSKYTRKDIKLLYEPHFKVNYNGHMGTFLKHKI